MDGEVAGLRGGLDGTEGLRRAKESWCECAKNRWKVFQIDVVQIQSAKDEMNSFESSPEKQ